MLRSASSDRLLSLDLFRGLTMFLLMAEAAGLYHAWLEASAPGSWGHALAEQFHHHPWHGLRFWDLIQPFFMFIVGVAMPFSYASRRAKGQTPAQLTRHVLRRCLLLLLLGVGLHCVYAQRLVWELWNVLTQLSFTVLVTYFVMRLPWRGQLAVSLGILVLADGLYRLYAPGAPFVKDANFGSWMDLLLMGKLNGGGGWVTINCLSTSAHTIWGALIGQHLLGGKRPGLLRPILIGALVALFLGYGLDLAGLTPIVKRIATSSFVLVSGGWALLVLAGMYALADIRGWRRGIGFFAVVGMNSIFIYLFDETIGHQWLRGFSGIFTQGFLGPLGLPAGGIAVATALLTLAICWYLCWFLFQKRIFFKI